MNLLRSDTDVHIRKSVSTDRRLAAEAPQCDHDAPLLRWSAAFSKSEVTWRLNDSQTV
jgi:hypothetical protein